MTHEHYSTTTAYIAAQAQLSRQQALAAVQAIETLILHQVQNGGHFDLPAIGRFELHTREGGERTLIMRQSLTVKEKLNASRP